MENKDTSKIDNWKKIMDEYYANISREQLEEDLKRAGFKLNDSKSDKISKNFKTMIKLEYIWYKYINNRK